MRSYKRARPNKWKPLIVRNVKPHPKTGILWLRLRTPQHLINRRAELEQMGVLFRVEHHRSLETRDPQKALEAYARKRVEIETLWKGWTILLEERSTVFSHRNIVALAGERAMEFFKQYEDDPFEMPKAEGVGYPSDDERARFDKLPLPSKEERAEFDKNVKRFFALNAETQRMQVFVTLHKHPFLKEELGPRFESALEDLVGRETDAALSARGLVAGPETRFMLNLEMAHLMSVAREGLEQRQSGDWRPVQRLQALPAFATSEERPVEQDAAKRSTATLTFEQVIAEQERLSALRLEKQHKSQRTFEGYRGICHEFAERRGSTNILTVTRQEVAKWRDEMIGASDLGKMRRKTIINKVGAIRSVLNWAIAHRRRDRREGAEVPEIFREGNPLSDIDLPEKETVESEARTHTKDQASILLRASREETVPILRWGQWLLTYSGARIGEVVQLEKRDFMEYDGHPYFMVRSDDVRTTKTRKSRRVPLHHALVAEGFLEFVKAAPEGRLFRTNEPAQTLREWAHSVMAPYGGFNGKPPIHGSRHLFGDLATGKLELAARYYIEGRNLPGSGKDYGGSAALVPELSRMINDIEPLIPLAGDEEANELPSPSDVSATSARLSRVRSSTTARMRKPRR